MDRKLQTQRLSSESPRDIALAARLLRDGGTVAFPTETVYGLGANALDPQAIARIFAAKQRPSWDPLIVHIADRSQLPAIATLPPAAEPLIARFWPGPLTLLLPRTSAIPDAVTAGRPLVGVRIPAHPDALALLREVALPIAAPSANRFGHTSPTSAEHVLADLDGRIDAVLDAGPATIGLESTVAELTPTGLLVYRPGAVTLPMLQQALGPSASVQVHVPPILLTPPESLPSPGVGIRHYAPDAPVLLVEVPAPDPHALLPHILAASSAAPGARTAVMLPDGWHSSSAAHTFAWGPWSDPDTLARRLFLGLRTLDAAGATLILCPLPPPDGLGAAIRDRLLKAARPR